MGSPVAYVHINDVRFPNTLIELRAKINTISLETMINLNLQGSLRKTTMVLQLVDKSKVAPKGIIDDVMVSNNSWKHLIYFLIHIPRTNFNIYPYILGGYWIETVEAYIDSRVGNMKIIYIFCKKTTCIISSFSTHH